jgi:two-component system, NarL family, response regulator DevR
MRLLIVEDSPIVAERLMELLVDVPGLEIAGSAGDVDATVRLIARVNPDAILLDLQIDGGTGLDVLRAAKASKRNIAVIVLTNSVLEPFRQACLDAGADYFLDKSNEFQQLPAILAQIDGESRLALRRDVEPADPQQHDLASSTFPVRRTGTK